MSRKFFVALSLVGPLHFIERFANERASRIEPPATLGASEAPKILSLSIQSSLRGIVSL